MAVLALPAIAAATGATAAGAGALGVTAATMAGGISIAGALLDATVIQPLIFGDDRVADFTGPKVSDFQFQTASEGESIKRVYGTARVAGNVIWMSEPRAFSATSSVGGKGGFGGGSGQQISSTGYKVSLAIAVCGNNVSSIKRIWGNTSLVYDSARAFNASSDKISVGVVGGKMRLKSFKQYIDFTKLVSGIDVNVSGFSNAENNGTFRLERVLVNSLSGAVSAAMEKRDPTSVVEAIGNTITVTQATPLYHPSKIGAFEIHTGNQTDPSDIMESVDGIGNVPLYKGITFVVFENLVLTNSGNVVPQFSFEVQESVTPTLQSVVSNICETSGMTASDYDVTGLTGNVDGYVVSGIQPVHQTLEPLAMRYDFFAYESNGVLVFKHRGSEDTYAISESDLGARSIGQRSPSPIDITTKPIRDLPTSVIVNYIDKDTDYNAGSEVSRLSREQQGNDTQIEVPVIMSSTDAKAIADRMLWRSHRQRHDISISLPPKYANINAGDLITVTHDSRTYTAHVTDATRGSNNFVTVNAKVRDSVSEATQSTDTSNRQDHNMYAGSNTLFEVIDIAPLRDSEANTPGFYWVASSPDSQTDWRSASVYQSARDNDSEFLTPFDQQLYKRPIMGNAISVLGQPSLFGIIDNVNTIDVEINDGSLSSVTLDQMLEGANFALIGNELISFKTATALGDVNQYRLSGLLRGLKGTEDTVSTHVDGERFVLLQNDDTVIRFQPVDSSVRGQTHYFRAVSEGVNVADVDSYIHTYTLSTIRPLPPVHVAIKRVGNAVTLEMFRRSRTRIANGETKSQMLEPGERYIFEVYDNATGTLRDTKEVIGINSLTDPIQWEYTVSEQTQDGLTPGEILKIKAFQSTELGGRSKEVEVIG